MFGKPAASLCQGLDGRDPDAGGDATRLVQIPGSMPRLSAFAGLLVQPALRIRV